MRLFKRIITSLLVVVTCVSLCLTTVFAAWYNDLAYNYTQSDFAQWAAKGVCSWVGNKAGAAIGTVVIPGIGSVSGSVIGTGAGLLASDGFNAFMNYLAQDSSYVSEEDYIASLDSPIIDNTMTGYPYDVLFSPSSDYDFYDFTNSSLEWNSSLNLSGTFYFYFRVAKSGSYNLYFPPFVCSCGLTHGHRGYSSVKPNFSYSVDGTSWSNLFTISTTSAYSSSTLSHVVNLYAGYVYRFSVFLSSPSNGYHFVSFGTPYLTGGSVVQDNPSSRISSFTQTINNYNTTNNTTNYYIGTTDANGSVNQVYDPDIFNEQTMIFKEPVTGEQYLCTGWKYSYSSGNRGYWLSLPENSYLYNGQSIRTVVLAYLDDALYIMGFRQELDVYDSIDDMSSDAVFLDKYDYVIATAINEGADHEHVYTSETITAPTCTDQGVRRYTCEICGYTRDEKIPATGHAWEATETVETEVNENGDVTKLGYTVYTCSVCGETYKQYDGTGQPGPPGSDDSGTSSGFWDRIKNAFLNALSSLIEKLLDFITNVLSAVLDLLYDLLSFFFDFLTSTVISGIGGFFSSFTDGTLFQFFQSEDGTGYALPEGVAGVFAFFSGVIMLLPWELRSLLIFGIAAMILLGVFKLVKS